MKKQLGTVLLIALLSVTMVLTGAFSLSASAAEAEGISLDQTSATISVGEKLTLKAAVTPNTETVTWETSDANIATVSSSGKVKALKPGTVTIKATAGGQSATCEIAVHHYVTMRIGKTVAIRNGKMIKIDNDGTKPFKVSGRTLIPLRFVGEKMGGKVKYVADDQPITVTYGEYTVEFSLGSDIIKKTVGGVTEEIKIDVVAQKDNGRTYIPLRAISQALGFQVYYENGTEYIVVNTPRMSKALRTGRLEEARTFIG